METETSSILNRLGVTSPSYHKLYTDADLAHIILPGQIPSPELRQRSKMDCSKIEIRLSEDLCNGHGDGAFAKVPIKRGELVEYGVMRRLPLDGNSSTYVFTWSEDRTVWATAGGNGDVLQ